MVGGVRSEAQLDDVDGAGPMKVSQSRWVVCIQKGLEGRVGRNRQASNEEDVRPEFPERVRRHPG